MLVAEGFFRQVDIGERGTRYEYHLTERGETLDLIRRHIAELGREFQNLGYSQVNFNFGANTSDTSAQHQGAGEHDQALTAQAEMMEDILSIPLGALGGIDIRL